jgi:hypothetical protein
VETNLVRQQLTNLYSENWHLFDHWSRNGKHETQLVNSMEIGIDTRNNSNYQHCHCAFVRKTIDK